MSEEVAAVLILIALAAGVFVGHRVHMGKPRGVRAPGAAAGGAGHGGGGGGYTFGHAVTQQIAAGCGCS